MATDWAREYFEEGYGRRWRLRAPSEDVRQQAAGLWSLLNLSPNSRLIDIGCGHGRHALTLAQRGANVVGVDFSTTLLTRARQLATELHTAINLIRGDMRVLPFRSKCANAALMMDAFGFFDTDDEHDTVLREAARILEPGGRFVM